MINFLQYQVLFQHLQRQNHQIHVIPHHAGQMLVVITDSVHVYQTIVETLMNHADLNVPAVKNVLGIRPALETNVGTPALECAGLMLNVML